MISRNQLHRHVDIFYQQFRTQNILDVRRYYYYYYYYPLPMHHSNLRRVWLKMEGSSFFLY